MPGCATLRVDGTTNLRGIMPISNTLAKLADGLVATISGGGTVSTATDLYGYTLCGVFIPTGFQGTAISFHASISNSGTYSPMKDGAGAAVSKTVAGGDYVYLDPAVFAGVRFVKIVSNATEAGSRDVTLAARPL